MPTNPARTGEEARRRLLNAMGIDVWYPRVAGDSTAADVRTAGEAGARTEAATAPAAVTASGATDGKSPATGVTRTEAASLPPAGATAAPRDATPFAVVALGVPGALLVVPAFSGRGEATLARDLVRAARRNWTAEVAEARFDWPQPGVSGKSTPALAAFVEKQAEDFKAELMLVSESASRYLGDFPVELVRVPDMASLAEPRNKLKLWRQLKVLTA